MSAHDPRTPGGGSTGPRSPDGRTTDARSPGDDPVQLSRADEIMYVQERYQQEPKPPATATATAPASRAPASPADLLAAAPPDVAPTRTLAALPPARGLGAARLLTAVLALVLAAAFFYPAIHDAIDRKAQLLPLTRDGKTLAAPADGKPVAAPTPPASGTSAYLSIDSKPPGATVIIDGFERGTTPLIANVPCITGSPLTVELTATGHAPWRTQVTCERDLVFAIAPSLTRAARR